MSSIDEISAMFDTESAKLDGLIDIASSKPELTVHEIVDTYYQIMNVSSMITMLKQQLDSQNHHDLLEKIAKTEAKISEKFNSDVHPQVMAKIAKSIQDTTNNLQSKSENKTTEDIQNDAKLYDELREKMSTKEFVEQYDKGLQ